MWQVCGPCCRNNPPSVFHQFRVNGEIIWWHWGLHLHLRNMIMIIIVIHSKYFAFADWFKPHAYFTITSCCSPNLNQWHQDDVKSVARCRLLNCWPRKPERNGKTPWRRKKYFEWINLEGCYPPRPSASMDNTLLDLQNSSYPTQPHVIVAN